MIKLNEYLKKIGINEENWLFKEKREEDENGFVYQEFFNLDTTLAMYIYSHLCYFKENCNVGHPGRLTAEKWDEILDIMIEGFKLYLQSDNYDEVKPKERHYISKNREKKIKYGMRLFIKYFGDLWY